MMRLAIQSLNKLLILSLYQRNGDKKVNITFFFIYIGVEIKIAGFVSENTKNSTNHKDTNHKIIHCIGR